MGYLISETTKEEREKIVADSLGNINANCDGCMAGLADMYQDYIDGRKELRQINMEFNARYIKGDDMPDRGGCSYQNRDRLIEVLEWLNPVEAEKAKKKYLEVL